MNDLHRIARESLEVPWDDARARAVFGKAVRERTARRERRVAIGRVALSGAVMATMLLFVMRSVGASSNASHASSLMMTSEVQASESPVDATRPLGDGGSAKD